MLRLSHFLPKHHSVSIERRELYSCQHLLIHYINFKANGNSTWFIVVCYREKQRQTTYTARVNMKQVNSAKNNVMKFRGVGSWDETDSSNRNVQCDDFDDHDYHCDTPLGGIL